jgi:hypothetical protein
MIVTATDELSSLSIATTEPGKRLLSALHVRRGIILMQIGNNRQAEVMVLTSIMNLAAIQDSKSDLTRQDLSIAMTIWGVLSWRTGYSENGLSCLNIAKTQREKMCLDTTMDFINGALHNDIIVRSLIHLESGELSDAITLLEEHRKWLTSTVINFQNKSDRIRMELDASYHYANALRLAGETKRCKEVLAELSSKIRELRVADEFPADVESASIAMGIELMPTILSPSYEECLDGASRLLAIKNPTIVTALQSASGFARAHRLLKEKGNTAASDTTGDAERDCIQQMSLALEQARTLGFENPAFLNSLPDFASAIDTEDYKSYVEQISEIPVKTPEEEEMWNKVFQGDWWK